MNFKYHGADRLKSMLDKNELDYREEREARSVLVDRFMRKHGVNTMSQMNENDSGNFSRSGCDCCSHGLGNTVVEVVGFNPRSKEIVDLGDICMECIEIYYNGV